MQAFSCGTGWICGQKRRIGYWCLTWTMLMTGTKMFRPLCRVVRRCNNTSVAGNLEITATISAKLRKQMRSGFRFLPLLQTPRQRNREMTNGREWLYLCDLVQIQETRAALLS